MDSTQSKDIYIEKGLSSAIVLDQCPFQIISSDAYNQITFGSMELALPKLDYLNEIRKSFFFRFENFFPCLSTIIPDNSSIFEGTSIKRVRILIKTSTLLKNLEFLLEEEKELMVSLKLRTCDLGEYFDMEKKSCIDCDPNFYSFKVNFLEPSVCKSCDNEPFFCYGGSKLSPKKGYWRSGYSTIKFLRCPGKSGEKQNKLFYSII